MSRKKRHPGTAINRRDLLRKAGQAAFAPLALTAAVESAAADPPFPPPQRGLVPVYRLQPCPPGHVSGQRCSCNACVKHAVHKYFASSQAANTHRAHLHCNCFIVAQLVRVADFIAMFRPNTPYARVVFDTRWS